MGKIIKRYYQAWELRQQGKKLREIGQIMGFGVERARFMVKYIDVKIRRKQPISHELKKLTMKYGVGYKNI